MKGLTDGSTQLGTHQQPVPNDKLSYLNSVPPPFSNKQCIEQPGVPGGVSSSNASTAVQTGLAIVPSPVASSS